MRSQLARTAGARKGSSVFDFFFNAISAKPDGVSKSARKSYVEAYSRPDAPRDWI